MREFRCDSLSILTLMVKVCCQKRKGNYKKRAFRRLYKIRNMSVPFGYWRVVIIIVYIIWREANRFSVDDDGKCWNTCAAISFAFFHLIWFVANLFRFVVGLSNILHVRQFNIDVYIRAISFSCLVLYCFGGPISLAFARVLLSDCILLRSITCHWSSLAI